MPVGVAEAVTYRDSLGNRVSQGGRVDRASLEVRAELGEREEQVLVAAEAATVEPVARETAAVTAAMVVMAAMEAVTGLDSDLEAASAVSSMIG